MFIRQTKSLKKLRKDNYITCVVTTTYWVLFIPLYTKETLAE